METKKRKNPRVELMAKCALRSRKPVKALELFNYSLTQKHSHDYFLYKLRYGTLRRTVISFTTISKCSHTMHSIVEAEVRSVFSWTSGTG